MSTLLNAGREWEVWESKEGAPTGIPMFGADTFQCLERILIFLNEGNKGANRLFPPDDNTHTPACASVGPSTRRSGWGGLPNPPLASPLDFKHIIFSSVILLTNIGAEKHSRIKQASR